MKKSYQVRIKVTSDLENQLFQFIGSSRYAFNWAKNRVDEYYKEHKKTISESDLRKEFTQFKKLKGNEWMSDISNDVFKQAIRDCYRAYKNFFRDPKKFKPPHFKKRRDNNQSFYNDTIDSKLEVKSNKVRLCKLGWLDICQCNYIPFKQDSIKYMNPRIKFDGVNWIFSIGVDDGKETKRKKNKSKLSYGIDLGLKKFATIVDSNDNITIIKTLKSKFKKLEKKRKRIQRKISKRNEEYKKQAKKLKRKRGESVNDRVVITKSNNYYKLLKKLNKVTQKETNVQSDLINQCISILVKSKPKSIVIEDLNIKGMMKNRRLAKWIGFNQFYRFRIKLENKCLLNNIKLIIADRFFASSKTCSQCGRKKKKLSLSTRIYKCRCGYKEDRDINAARNLLKLAS